MALSAERDREKAYAGDISPRPSEARDETQLHRIVTASYHDWYGRCGGFGSQRRGRGDGRGQHGHLTANQVGNQRRQSIVLSLPPSGIR